MGITSKTNSLIHSLRSAVFLVVIIFSFSSLLPQSAMAKAGFKVKGSSPSWCENWGSLTQRKMVLGSGPPRCVSKCFGCRPCVATIVIHRMEGSRTKASSASHGEEDDSYYLLSWKCRCGNKLYQP